MLGKLLGDFWKGFFFFFTAHVNDRVSQTKQNTLSLTLEGLDPSPGVFELKEERSGVWPEPEPEPPSVDGVALVLAFVKALRPPGGGLGGPSVGWAMVEEIQAESPRKRMESWVEGRMLIGFDLGTLFTVCLAYWTWEETIEKPGNVKTGKGYLKAFFL